MKRDETPSVVNSKILNNKLSIYLSLSNYLSPMTTNA